jgi:hypothetical protein
MVQKVFFSFHYERELWRANYVRNSWERKPDKVAAGFFDSVTYEKMKIRGDSAIKDWIDAQLQETTVTVVLIGSEAFNRPYCKYAIEKSYERGNGMFGIFIHKLNNNIGNISPKGSNNFGEIGRDKNNNSVFFSINYPTYEWVDDNGCYKLKDWVDKATNVVENKNLATKIF